MWAVVLFGAAAVVFGVLTRLLINRAHRRRRATLLPKPKPEPGSRPVGVYLHADGLIYRLDDTAEEFPDRPGVWIFYGPPHVSTDGIKLSVETMPLGSTIFLAAVQETRGSAVRFSRKDADETGYYRKIQMEITPVPAGPSARA